jgi:hypothetical protein
VSLGNTLLTASKATPNSAFMYSSGMPTSTVPKNAKLVSLQMKTPLSWLPTTLRSLAHLFVRPSHRPNLLQRVCTQVQSLPELRHPDQQVAPQGDQLVAQPLDLRPDPQAAQPRDQPAALRLGLPLAQHRGLHPDPPMAQRRAQHLDQPAAPPPDLPRDRPRVQRDHLARARVLVKRPRLVLRKLSPI